MGRKENLVRSTILLSILIQTMFLSFAPASLLLSGEVSPLAGDVRVVAVIPSTTTIFDRSIVTISVQVENTYDTEKSTVVDVFVDETRVGRINVTIPANSTKTYSTQWNALGYIGSRSISAAIIDHIPIPPIRVVVLGLGYYIIVAGSRSDGELNYLINQGCNNAYKTLLAVGIPKDRIYYMCQPEYYPQDVDGDGYNDVSAVASNANLQYAIQTWALGKVGVTGIYVNPLTLYLLDHGGVDVFCIDRTEILTATQLDTWLDNLELNSGGVAVRLIYEACESGSFIDNLAKATRLVATSSRADQDSSAAPGGGAFGVPFWNDIKSGHNIALAFNTACSSATGQNPLLDDDGNGVGHTGPLPNGGDGYKADDIHIGSCEWPYPWISQVVRTFCYSWPPPNVALWVKVQNQTSLAHVRAWMVPPDWVPSQNGTLQPLGAECFEMADPEHDGNWTVNVPAANFTDYATGPSNFTFYITVEETDGNQGTPAIVQAQFTATGDPPPDTVSPLVHVERPLEDRVVSGVIKVNGTASDDVCLDRVQIYVDDALRGTVIPPPMSTSFFELGVDTTGLTNGNHTVQVKAIDTSNNSETETMTIWVQNFVHDLAATNLEVSKPIICQGLTSNIHVNVANHGSYAENFNVSLYANSTFLGVQPVTLAGQDYTTLTFAWNTTGFAKGNYTLSVVASTAPGETNTADNTLIDGWLFVTIPGDINADDAVNIVDIVIIAVQFGRPPPPITDIRADANNDGKVNIVDIAYVAIHFGQKG